MDAIRTLLLARTHVVVLDPDVAASAATRPSRDTDLEKFEDELAQLGFVMSLDLAITVRRLPNQAIQELRSWIVSTLAKPMGTQRPLVPLPRAFPSATPQNTASLYMRRVMSWLATRSEQPCPWCGQAKEIRPLDPCGHLVCVTCWGGGSYAGCPICHRRVALGAAVVPATRPEEQVSRHDGQLRLLHLAFDLLGTARARFEELLARTTTPSPEDRAEIEAIVDALGPRAAAWLPAKIAARETMAIAIARLWVVAPDRTAMAKAAAGHLKTATDVLRVAMVLMGANPGLAEPMRLGPITRGLRRMVLEALDRLPAEPLVEEVCRHAGLWKRTGERLHPFELAARFPTAALAFAVVRGTKLSTATFGDALRAHTTQLASVRIEGDRLRASAWLGAVEKNLAAGDARAASERLAARPAEVLRRADHLIRVAQARQPDALGTVLRTIQYAMTRGGPGELLALGAHIARRGATLRPEAIASIVDAVRAELVVRAESRRHFARAVIDRALADVAITGRPATPTRPTLWDVACIHAIARANLVYVRERTGAITQYRRRDGESAATRLVRIASNAGDDGTLAMLPPAEAPTWFCLLRDDLVIPKGSAGHAVERRSPHTDGITYLEATELVTELAAKP